MMAGRFLKIRKVRCFLRAKIVFCFFSVFLLSPCAHSQDGFSGGGAADAENADVESALVYLNRASAFLNSGDVEFAHTAVNDGISCSDTVADLFYLQAVLYSKEGYPLADVLASAHEAFQDGRHWFRFDREIAAVFTAGLLVETARYQEALALLNGGSSRASADADSLRCRIYYASGNIPAAREMISMALKRWSSDIRFPLLFFQFENPVDSTGGFGRGPDVFQAFEIATEIVASWNILHNADADASLSLQALPFVASVDPDAASMIVRRLWYMGGREALPDDLAPAAVTAAFREGLLGGSEAVDAFFERRADGIALQDLLAFCSAALVDVNDAAACEEIAAVLSAYDGVVFDDVSGDRVPDSFVSYKQGRPYSAVYDVNQDGYQDMVVDCAFGEPVSLVIPGVDFSVEYRSYPSPSMVKTGDTVYSMRPNGFAVSPISVRPFDFGFLTSDFFFLSPDAGFAPPDKARLAEAAVSSMETTSGSDGGEIRVETVYDEFGRPFSVRKTRDGSVFSDCVYRDGLPFEERLDEDGDEYFEKRVFYDGGGRIVSLSVDVDKDSAPDYTENFNDDGSVLVCWYEDGASDPAVRWTKMPDGRASAVWLHPETAIPVTVVFQNAGGPQENENAFTVTYRGETRDIVYDGESGFWWFERVPAGSREIASSVAAAINQTDSPVVSVYVPVETGIVYVVKAGGKTFAEFMYDNRSE